jgi:hypothetical protein
MKKLLLCALLTIAATSAKAEVILNALDSGWYNASGSHISTNTNYIAGICSDCTPRGTDFRNFFVFDTSLIAGQVTSAKLQLSAGVIATSGIYTLFDVTTPVESLVAGGTNQLASYQDLGEGVSYGTANLLASQSGGIVEITLNTAAIAAINMSPNLFAVGGSFASAGFQAFGNTGNGTVNQTRRLIVNFEPAAVPVPGTIVLLGLGMFGIGLSASRRLAANKR